MRSYVTGSFFSEAMYVNHVLLIQRHLPKEELRLFLSSESPPGTHLCVTGHRLLLQREHELALVSGFLLTLHLRRTGGPRSAVCQHRGGRAGRSLTSVMGKACCWVSSLRLTTNSTSVVSSRQPACSWPDALTMVTSRAMCSSGRPSDCSIFLQEEPTRRL